MQNFKLAQVLLESTPQFFAQPLLYCRADAALIESQDGAWTLKGPGTFDFTTFFNALSVLKWQRYTVAHTFFLHLEVSGDACTYEQTRADSFSWFSEPVEGTQREIKASQTWQTFDIPLAIGPDVLVSFVLYTNGSTQIRNSYYYTQINESDIRPVELALCTTTFKKEAYITHNVDLVKDCILASDEPIAQHFHMHVVDNGRTLDPHDVEAERVHLHPNQNAGGSGGFARGMIEAMQQTPQATHVLLMDDDVNISPESIKRTFNLLQIVNDEYKDAFVSGAMMKINEPSVRNEDLGYLGADGRCHALKPQGHMDVLHDVVMSEAFLVAHDTVESPEMANQHYAAWWYCVVPMTAIKQHGLPLPFFVRFDDVEYGLRCHPKFMTMVGISVWHMAFELRYSPAAERYQAPRNSLIAQAMSNIAPHSDFVESLRQGLRLELKKYSYKNARLLLDALEDYLKGPEFFSGKGVAEDRYLTAMKNEEKLLSEKEIQEAALKHGVDLSQISYLQACTDTPRSFKDKVVDYVTLFGNRMGAGYFTKDEPAIVMMGESYAAGRMRRASQNIALNVTDRTGVIRHHDQKQYDEIRARYKVDMKQYKARKDELERDYREARDRITSVEFWRDYLGI